MWPQPPSPIASAPARRADEINDSSSHPNDRPLSIAAERIREAASHKRAWLSLVNLGLKAVPTLPADWNLRELDLSGNDLRSLPASAPPELARLIDEGILTVLDLRRNNLRELPPWVDDLVAKGIALVDGAPRETSHKMSPSQRDAIAVCKLVRKAFEGTVKSGNKQYSDAYGSADGERKLRRAADYPKANDLIRHHRDRGISGAKVLSFDRSRRAGNCDEYADAAVHHARRLGCSSVWSVWTDPGNPSGEGHAFCVIGLRENPGPIQVRELSGRDLGDAWVCDAWAGIVCRFDDYPAEFKSKMHRWMTQGKEVYSLSGNDGQGGFILAAAYGMRFLETRLSFLRETSDAKPPLHAIRSCCSVM